MRTSPSIVPHGADQDIYLMLDDCGGQLGCGWSRDASEEVALEQVRKAAAEDREISETLQEFIETHLGRAIGLH